MRYGKPVLAKIDGQVKAEGRDMTRTRKSVRAFALAFVMCVLLAGSSLAYADETDSSANNTQSAAATQSEGVNAGASPFGDALLLFVLGAFSVMCGAACQVYDAPNCRFGNGCALRALSNLNIAIMLSGHRMSRRVQMRSSR